MLSTYIREIYKKDENKELADAIEDIASAIDTNGWASAGIYCFWDPSTYEVLYIGLARDLSTRFKQHNGIIACKPKCCKIEQINKWFKSNTHLGYTILVQSMLSQPEIAKNKNSFVKSPFIESHSDIFDPEEAIGITEGLLIEAEKLASGVLPSWNKIGGSKYGKSKATSNHNELTDIFTNKKTDYFVAMRTIREVSADPTVEAFELYLHGVRQIMALHNINFIEAWASVPDDFGEKTRILEAEYVPHLSNYI